MSTVKNVDCIISAKWILPIIPDDHVFEDCSLIIQSGRIIAIEPSENVEQHYTSVKHLRLEEHVLMPGLVNTHGHAAMSLMRGMADDLPLMTWLEGYIWPTENQWVSEHFVEDGTRLAIAEMLKTGTTCFSDMYFFPEVTANVARNEGIRAQIAFPILDFPSVWAKDADDYIHKGLQLYDDYRSNSRVNIAFGPHAPYTVSDEPLKQIATLADQLQCPIHIHLHETAFEVEQSIKDHGVRPVQRLEQLGVLTPMTQCVHFTQASQDDIDLVASSGASIIHCPESNLKLASGICPIEQFTAAGVNVSLGTDGAASNNDLDMFGELATAALLSKASSMDATAGRASDILKMATLGGAKTLGIDDQIGSLEVGKQADIIAVKMDHISCHPMYSLQSNLVYSNRHIEVTHSWVEGKLLLDNKKLTNINESDLKIRARSWKDKISGMQK